MDVLLDSCGQRGVKPLLLIYLLVVRAAADCPKPQGKENMVLTQAALLLNHYPEKSDAAFECANGYVKESGSGEITCINGKWTEPDLTCKKMDCGPPKRQPNMNFNTSGGTLFGAVVEIICDKGYELNGPSFIQCYVSGWTGRRAKCDVITCEIPDEVTNGKHSWHSADDPEYGEVIQYTCDEGYTLIGKDKIVCGETGVYDSQPPECREESTSTDSPATSTAHRENTMKISAPPPPSVQESTATDSPATPPAHRDKTMTSSTTPPASPSIQGGSGIMIAPDKATTASVTSTTSSSFQDKHGEAIDSTNDSGSTAVITSVICAALGSCILVFFLHKYVLRRKGSYDTQEDQKPELLQFQNL